MKRQGDKETRGQGDAGTAPASGVPSRLLSPSSWPFHHLSCSDFPRVSWSPCPRVSSRPPRRAFTLPEVLATLVLVGLVLPAVMKGISLALAASDDARRRVEAVGLAENKLAEMTADASANIGTGGGGEFGDEAPGYRWEATTADVDTNLTELTVRVSWTARGAERWVDLSSYAFVNTSTGATTGGTGATGGGGGTP